MSEDFLKNKTLKLLNRSANKGQISIKDLMPVIDELNSEYNLLKKQLSHSSESNKQKLLSSTALEMLDLKTHEEIYDYVAQKLYKLFDKKAIITVVDFNTEKDHWNMVSFRGIDRMAKFSRITGFDIKDMSGNTDTRFYEQLTRGRLVKLDFDVPDLTGGKVPRIVGEQIKRLFALKDLYCITFQKNKNVFGNVSIFPRKDAPKPDHQLVEAFIAQVSLFVEKIRTKHILKESEEKYRAIFETSPDAITINNMNIEYVDANQGFTNLTGYSLEEVAGKKPSDLHLAPFGELEQEFRDAINEMGYFENVETRIYPKECNPKTVLFSAKVISFNDEPHIISVLKDITSLRAQEKKIIKLQNRYKTIVANMPNGAIFLFDKNLKFKTVAGKTFEELGLNPQGYINKNLYDILPEKAAEYLEQYYRKILKGKNVNFILEHDGHHFSNWGVPLKNDKGETIEGLIYAIDITHLKNKEKQLQSALEKAEQSDRLKSAFLTNISHEIRTPMNGVIGFIELLKSPELSHDEREEYLEIIESSGKRMINLLDNLVEISLVHANQVKVNSQSFNLNELLLDLHRDMKSIAKEKNIDVSVYCDLKSNESEIISDAVHLQKALLNLTENALKFTSKGKIDFGYHLKNDTLLFFVKDTGVGIPKEMQKKIFNLFNQADMNLNRKYEGAGLGLSIAEAYIKLMDGAIWLESSPGEGSSFFFTIPYKKP